MNYTICSTSIHWCRFRGGEEAAPLGSDFEGGEIRLVPFFLASNTHLATRNPEFRTEIEPECGEDLFLLFGLHLNLGAKFRNSGLK